MPKVEKEKKLGRPKINENARALVCKLYDEDEMTCGQIAKACNISSRSVYRILQERKIEDGSKDK